LVASTFASLEIFAKLQMDSEENLPLKIAYKKLELISRNLEDVLNDCVNEASEDSFKLVKLFAVSYDIEEHWENDPFIQLVKSLGLETVKYQKFQLNDPSTVKRYRTIAKSSNTKESEEFLEKWKQFTNQVNESSFFEKLQFRIGLEELSNSSGRLPKLMFERCLQNSSENDLFNSIYWERLSFRMVVEDLNGSVKTAKILVTRSHKKIKFSVEYGPSMNFENLPKIIYRQIAGLI
jgi:hypothetical protein